MTELSLATSEARDVLAAVVARVARDADLDVLLIKGPSLAAHGLRRERAWGDVDILVRPQHTSGLQRELMSLGWTVWNETPGHPVIARRHAITFIHPRWHTEIDAHTFLPGSYADPAATFDRLWGERALIQLAHQPVTCTGRIGSALVAALNLARTPASPRTPGETQQWREAVSNWPDPDRMALAELAAESRAADALAPLFDSAGVPAVGRGAMTHAEQRDWEDRVGQEAHRGYAWRAAIRRAPLRETPRLAIRALTYDRDAAERGAPRRIGWARIRHVTQRFGLALSILWRWKR